MFCFYKLQEKDEEHPTNNSHRQVTHDEEMQMTKNPRKACQFYQ